MVIHESNQTKMASIIPIKLQGDNLNERHRYLSSLENNITKVDEYEEIKNALESSPIDRIFKIDLACKLRDVDYIIKILQDDDMLYVNRALKSKWLLEPKYQYILNPEYLETHLYPNMITTAVTKMKHWIYTNLKDSKRSQHFYKFYYETNFVYAVKFFSKCSNDFIVSQLPKIIYKITPNNLKILCAKSTEVAKIFFDALSNDETLKTIYLAKDQDYFKSIKCLLKTDAHLFLNIAEKYFDENKFRKFSRIATKYIIEKCRERFWLKPELYAAWLLDFKTMSACLTVEECKDLVSKLARAKYLSNWFSYKAVEPLIKRLKPEDRPAFKKIIFVKREIGDEVENWPYDTPSAPKLEDYGPDIFKDYQHEPYEYGRGKPLKRLIKKKCLKRCYVECDMVSCVRSKTLLDKLYDEFRFSNFEKTMYELRKRIPAESSLQNREYMMLVLVSKSGGREDTLASLLELLALHYNEPANVRAAVVRSLVKRAFVWRLPEDSWQNLLKFAHGLGLDGKPAEADCIEGLHAVVIRGIILNKTCEADVFKSYLENFADLSSFSLLKAEEDLIRTVLPELILKTVNEAETVDDKINNIEKLIDILCSYNVKIATYPNFLPSALKIVEQNFSASESLLMRLYNMRVARKELFRYTFQLTKSDCSYVNALKHDCSVIDVKKFVDAYENEGLKTDNFLRKLTIYFGEKNSLADKIISEIKSRKPNKVFGRPLAILLRDELTPFIDGLKTSNEDETKLLALAIRANLHLARPLIDLNTTNWEDIGAQIVINKAIICRQLEIEEYIKKLLDWKSTIKITFEMSKRIKKQTDILTIIAKKSTDYALRCGFKMLKDQSDDYNVGVWEIIKPIIEELDVDKINKLKLGSVMDDVKSLPLKIQPEYVMIMYSKYKKMLHIKHQSFLCHIELLLSLIEPVFIENILKTFLDEFVPEKLSDDYHELLFTCLYLRILVKFLLLSKTTEIQKQRCDDICKTFLVRMEAIYKFSEDKKRFFMLLDEVLLNLKYTHVFLSSEYVSSLPVFECIVKWMQEVLPMEMYFTKFVKIHLNMLYYKAIKQSLIKSPELFHGDQKKLRDRVNIVGYNFGKLMAKEVVELTDKYFVSIIELYKESLDSFLLDYFNYTVSSDFYVSIVKGILAESQGVDNLLAVHLIEQKSHMIENSLADLKETVLKKDDLQTHFFAHAYIM